MFGRACHFSVLATPRHLEVRIQLNSTPCSRPATAEDHHMIVFRTCLLIGFALPSVSESSADDSIQPTGYARIFLDDQHVASESSIKRTLQQPQKLLAPVITSQGDWDSSPYLFGTVIFDHQDQIYKAWYMSYNYGQPMPVRTPFLYATSRNGRDWTYPNLGLFEHQGSKQNNIILHNAGHHDSYSPSVIKDLNESDPSRRYKMIFWDFSAEGSYNGDEGMMIAFSPDGIHWKRWQKKPALASAKIEQSISDVMDVLIDPLKEVRCLHERLGRSLSSPPSGRSHRKYRLRPLVNSGGRPATCQYN